MLGRSEKPAALCSGCVVLPWQSELGQPALHDPGADLPGPPATPIPLNQQIHNGYITMPADPWGCIGDRLGNSTLPAAAGASEGPEEAKLGASGFSRASGRAHPHSGRAEPKAGAMHSVPGAAESKGNDRGIGVPAGSAAGQRRRRARALCGTGARPAAGRGPPRRAARRAGGARAGPAVPTEPGPAPSPGSAASRAASSAQSAEPGLASVAAFTHPVLSFPRPGAIPSGNSWDIEADCKTAAASPCQDFPIVTAR